MKLFSAGKIVFGWTVRRHFSRCFSCEIPYRRSNLTNAGVARLAAMIQKGWISVCCGIPLRGRISVMSLPPENGSAQRIEAGRPVIARFGAGQVGRPKIL